MQFVRNGPDVPEHLLQAHEDGRVVLFCGAGISYPARLPGFRGLVDKLYESLGCPPDPVQQAAINSGQFDTAVGLLEARLVGGRPAVRAKLARILEPDLTAPTATRTHEALLTLGRSREGRMRLITTNFDRLFEEVIAKEAHSVSCFQAPLLPVPKNRWDGLVYLHGVLSKKPTVSELDQLVVSSGDFGLAYLTERWAARFVSELFRTYTICFVGYSINDPVLRYMMDALAADRLLGETPPEMFAFGSYSKGKEEVRANEWQAKNVTPILYREYNRHAYLHKTLHAWAGTYRDGVRGKERIVGEYCALLPTKSTKQDDFVGRLVWALSDANGLPAKQFAEADPVPSLGWLQPLLPIINGAMLGNSGNEVQGRMAQWLIRHLDDPALLHWLVRSGDQPNDKLIGMIKSRLDELETLEYAGDKQKLALIRSKAPNAIPSQPMRTLWHLFMDGRVRSSKSSTRLYEWRAKFNRNRLTTMLRLELRDLLTPRVSLREPLWQIAKYPESNETEVIDNFADWDIVLSTEFVHSGLDHLQKDQNWREALPALLNDFNALLRDALDLMHTLGGADQRHDKSMVCQPSISEHSQNSRLHDWTALIDLVRDAWLATAERSVEEARLIADAWRYERYPVFRRLAFFAAAQEQIIPARHALNWLLADDHWWLWSAGTQREAIRLVVALVPQLDENARAELEHAILTGPPRDMFKDDLEPDKWSRLVDREVWRRLAKIAQTGTAMGVNAKARLDALAIKYPMWRLSPDQSDEFPFWMSGGDELREVVNTPRLRRDLIVWLKQYPETDDWKEDDWRERCRNDFATTACALCALAKEGSWPNDRWREALQAWRDETHLKRSWRHIGPVLLDAPEENLQAFVHALGFWLRAVAKFFEHDEAEFFFLAERILDFDYKDDEESDDPVTHAINHPVGFATEALLNWWYRQSPSDHQMLPIELKHIFSKICDVRIRKFRHGRVLLAHHSISLFRVDEDWFTSHLLPHFSWQSPFSEERSAWTGFLWSPRLYRPLIQVLKPSLLDTAHHYAELGKYDEQYASLLTFAALDDDETFTIAELAAATRALPQEGLEDAAKSLVRALEGAGDRRGEYWNNRIAPYLQRVWPKTLEIRSPAIAEIFARLCVAAQDEFCAAFKSLREWLQPIDSPYYPVHMIHRTGLCGRFPHEALDFLSRVVGKEVGWPPHNLGDCLTAIQKAASELEAAPQFQRLQMLASKRH